MPGDKLFHFSKMDKCPSCGWLRGSLYVLAETQKEANTIRAEGGGLCGECMCNNIMETHGYITTQKEYVKEG